MKSLSPLYQRLIILVGSIAFFVIFGVIGFMYSEKMNFLDALWFSIMTLTTVGYGVPSHFSTTGKLISIFLMLFGVGAVLYALTSVALEIFNGSFAREYKRKLINKKMNNLKDHIVICGFGRNGREAARKLLLHGRTFVIIDQRGLENRNDEFGNTIFIHGNAVEDDILKKANIQNAYGLIAALPSDADNLFIVITAKQLNPKIKIVSRASNSNSVEKLKTAGAVNVIMPDKIGGEHMASLLQTPDLVEFMDNIILEGTKKINLLEVHTNVLNPKFLGKTIEDLQIFPRSGCKVIGYKNPDASYSINPDETKVIQKDGCLIIFGKPEQIIKIKEFIYK